MSDHMFEDRFFKTRRILELTIFFFLAFSLLSFSYSDFVPITKKVIYDINPNITVKPYVVDRTPLITYKDAEFFRENRLPKERLDLLWRLNLPYFYKEFDTITTYEDVFFPSINKNLKSYIYNHKDRVNILYIDYNSYGLNCSLNNYNLVCNFNKDLYGTKEIDVKTKYEDSNVLKLILDIKNTPDIKVELDNEGFINVTLDLGEQTINLENYVDFGVVKPINISKITTKSYTSSNSCNISNWYYLDCNFQTSGPFKEYYNLTIPSIPLFNLELPFKFNILSANQPPKYIEDSLPAGKTVIDSSYHKDFNMLELFEDEDSDLIFDFEQSFGNLAQCNPNGHVYSCDFSGNGYADIRFKASDEEGFVYSPYYRVALLNESDIEFIFDDYNQDSFKVVDTQAFDLPLKLKGLNFDVYDLNISIEGLEKNQTFDFNLPKDENIEFVFEDLNTHNDENEETLYPIAIKINGVDIDEIKVLSIPYEPNFLKNYLSVESYTPGDFIDYGVYGHHEVLPGFIFGIPYTITSNLNVPIELYVCQAIPKYSLEQNYKLFKKELENYNLIPENYFCEKKVLNEKTNVVMYVQNLDDYAIVQSLIISKTKIIPPTSLSGGFFNYLNNNSEILIYTNDVLSFYDFTEYVYSFIPEQSYGSNLNKNTEYNINVEFINGYAYEIVNVPVGIQASRSEVIAEYFDETDYYKITSDIKYIDLNYNKGNFASNINSSKTETFTFKTKDSSYDGSGPPWYKIASGTFLNNNFEKAGVGSKTFRIN